MWRAAVFVLALISISVRAEFACNVDLQFGMVVNSEYIRVIDEHRTVYQINDDNQLMFKGEWITLTPEQQADLKVFADTIHQVVPKMTLMANEGVKLAVETVQHVYLGLVGKDHDSYEKLQSALTRVQKKVRKKFIHANDHYYIGPGSLENVDEFVDQELEEQISKAINTSLGGILSAIGGLNHGTDDEINEGIESLSRRLGMVGSDGTDSLDNEHSLRQKAEWFCQKFRVIDVAEEGLRASLPQLQPYDVVVTGASQNYAVKP